MYFLQCATKKVGLFYCENSAYGVGICCYNRIFEQSHASSVFLFQFNSKFKILLFFIFRIFLGTQICKTYVDSWNMFFFFFRLLLVFVKFACRFSYLLIKCPADHVLISWPPDLWGLWTSCLWAEAAKRLTVLYKIKKKSNNVCISCVNLKLE